MLGKIISTIIIFFQSLIGFHQPENIFIPAQISTSLIEKSAFVENRLIPELPIRRWNVDDVDLNTASAFAMDVYSGKILYQKNSEQKQPIASLTKIMTAVAFLENFKEKDLEQTTTISKEAVETYGRIGNLYVGEKISLKNLLYILLMSSSNDAAVALAEYTKEQGEMDLVDLMNEKAQKLNLKNTSFIDPSGLDQDNISTAEDLIAITKYALNFEIIRDILKTNTIDLPSADGSYIHHLTNTNKLLNKIPEVIGGKTGYTEEAGKCMLLIIKISDKNNIIILAVLGAEDRFAEAEKLANWVKNAYVF